jgi:hypothetical protein
MNGEYLICGMTWVYKGYAKLLKTLRRKRLQTKKYGEKMLNVKIISFMSFFFPLVLMGFDPNFGFYYLYQEGLQ